MLPLWVTVVILGIIEGLTEFIPVSSTGHLLLTQHWLPRQSDLFNIVIQCGAVVAVLPLFKERLAMLTRLHEPASRDLLAKIMVSFFITGVGGLILDKLNFQLPEELIPVAIALIVGGFAFIIVEKWLKGRKLADTISWTGAVIVALAQLFAIVFPGSSRSGSTILFAMIFGASRVAATEFSFLVGIPSLLAAGGLKIFEAVRHGVQEDWALLALGTVVSAVVSFVAVKWLLRFVQQHTFIGFGVYRIVVGAILLLFFLR
ncbi:MAG TPA: undecaprenyl-diphosphate phosphatase [Chthoniobacterales bacterium]